MKTFLLTGTILTIILVILYNRWHYLKHLSKKSSLIPPQEKDSTEKITKKSEKETSEEMSKRLKKIKNPDQDKPFAKISKPEISEIPDEMFTEAPADTVKKPKRKKRSYKKKTTPKRPEE